MAPCEPRCRYRYRKSPTDVPYAQLYPWTLREMYDHVAMIMYKILRTRKYLSPLTEAEPVYSKCGGVAECGKSGDILSLGAGTGYRE